MDADKKRRDKQTRVKVDHWVGDHWRRDCWPPGTPDAVVGTVGSGMVTWATLGGGDAPSTLARDLSDPKLGWQSVFLAQRAAAQASMDARRRDIAAVGDPDSALCEIGSPLSFMVLAAVHVGGAELARRGIASLTRRLNRRLFRVPHVSDPARGGRQPLGERTDDGEPFQNVVSRQAICRDLGRAIDAGFKLPPGWSVGARYRRGGGAT